MPETHKEDRAKLWYFIQERCFLVINAKLQKSKIVLFIIMFVVTFFIAVPLQRYIDNRLEELKEDLIHRLEASLGAKIRYDSISPSIFRFLEIRNLRISDNSGDEASIVKISRVRALYSLIPLFSGNFGEALKEIRIENSRFVIDTERDRSLIDFFSGIISGRDRNSGQSLDTSVLITGRNLDLVLINPSGEFSLSRVFFTLDFQSEELEFRSKGKGKGSLYNQFLPVASIETDFTLSGTLARTLDWSNITVTVSNVLTDIVGIKKLSANLQVNRQGIRFRKIQDKSPFELSFSYQFDNRELSAGFLSENFFPSSVFVPVKESYDIQSWFESRISGNAGVSYFVDTGKAVYDGNIVLDLPVRFHESGLTGKVVFSGNENNVRFFPLLITSSYGNITYNGSVDLHKLYPEGRIDITRFSYPFPDRPIDAVFLLSRENDALNISGGARFGNQLLGDIRSTIIRRNSHIDFAASAFIETRDETVVVDGNWTWGNRPSLVLSGDILSVRTGSLAGLFDVPVPATLSSFVLNAGFQAKNDDSGFSFSLDPVSLVNPDNPASFARFAFKGINNDYSMELYELHLGDIHAHGRASITQERFNRSDVAVNFTINEFDYNIQGLLWDRNRLALSGSYGLEAYILLTQDYRFQFRIRDLPVPLSSTETMRVSINAGGLLGGDDWYVRLDEMRLNSLPFTRADLLFSGIADADGISIPDISYTDSLSPLHGQGFVSSKVPVRPADFIRLDGLSADGWFSLSHRTEEFLAYLSIDGSRIDSTVFVNRADISRIPDIPLKGRLSGNAKIRGRLDNPEFRLEFVMSEGELNNDPLVFDVSMVYFDHDLTINSINITYSGASLSDGKGKISLNSGDLDFTSGFGLRFREKTGSGRLTLDGLFVIDPLKKLADMQTSDFMMSVSLSDFAFADEMRKTHNLVVQKHNEIVSFQGGPQNSFSGLLSPDGSFSAKAADPLPVQFTARGVIANGNIDAEFRDIFISVAELESLLVFSLFSVYDGSIYGPSLSIRGPFTDPEIYGKLSARNLWATSRMIPELIGPFQAEFVLFEKEIFASNLALPVGITSISADIYFGMDHWFPQSYSISLLTRKDRPLPVASRVGKIEFDGMATGDILISGDNLGVDVKADLVVNSTLVTISNESYQRNEPSPYILTTDITITTGKGVEFLWPFKTLPILRTFAETGQRIHVQTNSADGSMSLSGEISIRGGEIFYFQRSFYLKNGKIVFNEDENDFDPILTARAEIRETGERGEDVRIFLIVDEKPFSQFAPRLESIPVYSEFQIAQILGSSVFSSTGNRDIGYNAAIIATEGLFEQIMLIRTFQNSVKDLMNLDIFTLRTQIIQRALLDKIMQEPEQEYDDSLLGSLGRYLDNTSLIGGKYLLDGLFIQAMLQVRSNEAFYREFGEDIVYRIETEVDLEWQTPFFMLDISLFPTQDVLGSFLNTQVGLSWRFSF